jgi:hypothetical protein
MRAYNHARYHHDLGKIGEGCLGSVSFALLCGLHASIRVGPVIMTNMTSRR